MGCLWRRWSKVGRGWWRVFLEDVVMWVVELLYFVNIDW